MFLKEDLKEENFIKLDFRKEEKKENKIRTNKEIMTKEISNKS